MSVEFYLNNVQNYQSGGQFWNVDFARLPASLQREALAAIDNPGRPESLVLLTNLQKQYPSAFESVSGLKVLPAPDLMGSVGGPFPFGASIDLILAYYNQEVIDTANDMSQKGKQRAVELSAKEMSLADKAQDESLHEAGARMGASVGAAAVSVGAGIGGGVVGGRSLKESSAHGTTMKDLGKEQRKSQEYQDSMERNIKLMQDKAQTNRTDATKLKAYADEASSPDGLSATSRQKIDDGIKQKETELEDLAAQKRSYATLTDDKKAEVDASNLSNEEKAAQKQALDQEQANFNKDVDFREAHLKEDKAALEAAKNLDDNTKQLKVDTDRLSQLTDKIDKSDPTPAEAWEMHQLKIDIRDRTQKVVDNRVVIQKRVDQLGSEAKILDESSADMQQAFQRELSETQKHHAEKEKDIGRQLEESGNYWRAITNIPMTVNSAAPLASAPGNFVADQYAAEEKHTQAEKQHASESRDNAQSFGAKLTEVADDANKFWQTMGDYYKQSTEAFAQNI